jgi:hypothetical protein
MNHKQQMNSKNCRGLRVTSAILLNIEAAKQAYCFVATPATLNFKAMLDIASVAI